MLLQGACSDRVRSMICHDTILYNRYRHPNLVPLMGYCEKPPCLVYPLMKRYSLFKNIHDSDIMKVSCDVYCTLAYNFMCVIL